MEGGQSQCFRQTQNEDGGVGFEWACGDDLSSLGPEFGKDVASAAVQIDYSQLGGGVQTVSGDQWAQGVQQAGGQFPQFGSGQVPPPPLPPFPLPLLSRAGAGGVVAGAGRPRVGPAAPGPAAPDRLVPVPAGRAPAAAVPATRRLLPVPAGGPAPD